ncbi:MAG TPA: LPFR motif small protein [Spirillospora sp.]
MRRISAALSAVIGTLVSIVTLPFRVLQRLLTSTRGRTRSRRRAV